jgi:hypothetical protein
MMRSRIGLEFHQFRGGRCILATLALRLLATMTLGRERHMRTVLYALLMLSLASTAAAGQLYGSIFFNGQPLRGVPVKLSCPGETKDGNTDAEGMYRLFARATGGCSLGVVEPNGRNASASVYSYDRPTAYNFDLVNRNGRWELVPRR